jgi:hypothetical protein
MFQCIRICLLFIAWFQQQKLSNGIIWQIKKSTFSICFNLPSWLLRSSSLTMRELHAIKQATWYMTCAPSPCLCLDHLFDQSSWFQTPLAIAFQSQIVWRSYCPRQCHSAHQSSVLQAEVHQQLVRFSIYDRSSRGPDRTLIPGYLMPLLCCESQNVHTTIGLWWASNKSYKNQAWWVAKN